MTPYSLSYCQHNVPPPHPREYQVPLSRCLIRPTVKTTNHIRPLQRLRIRGAIPPRCARSVEPHMAEVLRCQTTAGGPLLGYSCDPPRRTATPLACIPRRKEKLNQNCDNSTQGSLAPSKMLFLCFCLPATSDQVSPKHNVLHKLFPFSKDQVIQMRHSSQKRNCKTLQNK